MVFPDIHGLGPEEDFSPEGGRFLTTCFKELLMLCLNCVSASYKGLAVPHRGIWTTMI